MPAVARFRVVSPFLAVQLSAQKERFVTVSVGAIVETSADLQEPGLITITVKETLFSRSTATSANAPKPLGIVGFRKKPETTPARVP
jgi:hypothetical protein